MKLEELGLSGKVVLVDDNWEEIEPLYNMLKKESISCFYLEGNDSNFEYDFRGTRIIFLDMNLWPMTGSSSEAHGISRNLISLISKIIKKENGPYVIAVWSKTEDVNDKTFKKQMIEAISNGTLLPPMKIFSLNKSSYIQTLYEDHGQVLENLEFSLKKGIEQILELESIDNENLRLDLNELITSKIKEQQIEVKKQSYDITKEQYEKLKADLLKNILDVNEFYSFLCWERLLKKSNEEMIQELYRLFAERRNEEDLKNELKNMFSGLAKMYIGENYLNEENIYFYAYRALQAIFDDKLGREVYTNKKNYPRYIDFNEFGLKKNLEIKAKINSQVHLDFNEIELCYPGNVYRVEKQCKYKEMVLELFKEKDIKVGIVKEYNKKMKEKVKFEDIIEGHPLYAKLLLDYSKLIEDLVKEIVVCEITQNCDFAQDKKKFHKVLLGVMVKYNDLKEEEERKKMNLDKENSYTTPMFEYEGELVKIHFNFRAFRTLDLEECKCLSDANRIFRIKKELLSEIQVKFSNHIGRLGILSL